MTEREAILILAQAAGFSGRKLCKLVESGIPVSRFVNDPRLGVGLDHDLIDKGIIESLRDAKKRFKPEQTEKKCAKMGIRILTFFDADYPKMLKEIYDPPLLLYMKGALIPEDGAAVAAVGTRHPSPYGLRVAHKFSYELAGSGITIVSGLARGIDAEAHRGALDARGRTIAVLGCGLDMIYPKENEKLYGRITESGTLLSEFSPGTPPLAHHFPCRNRIIAGLSLGVLVVEAHSRSGSLITARLAAEEGREVYAVPGSIESVSSRGTNHLIEEGARMVTGSDGIIEDLRFTLRDYAGSRENEAGEGDLPDGSLSEAEKVVLGCFSEDESLTLDEIKARICRPLPCLHSALLQLELKGVLAREAGSLFVRSGGKG